MVDLKIDPTTRDLVIENGDLVLVDGVDAVRQDVDIRLNTFLGTWFLDQRIGIPYFERILGQKPRYQAIAGIFREAILETPGMVSLTDLRLDFDGTTRTLSVAFRGVASEGTFDYQSELIIG